MGHDEREPLALGTRRPSGLCQAGRLDSPDENNPLLSDFQSLGAVAAHIVAKIAQRHRLTKRHAATVCELSGIGGMA